MPRVSAQNNFFLFFMGTSSGDLLLRSSRCGAANLRSRDIKLSKQLDCPRKLSNGAPDDLLLLYRPCLNTR